MEEFIICKNCGNKIKVEEGVDIQYCSCGVYYRRNRGFVGGKWVKAGFWKGGKSDKELQRQQEKVRGKRKK